MNNNGKHSPLALSGPQRTAALGKLGLAEGWLLLSVSEMYDLKKAMDGCSKENERLNKQTAKLVAHQIVKDAVAVKSLKSARAVLAIIADRDAEPAMRIDALREVAQIDEALSILPKPEPEIPPEEKA